MKKNVYELRNSKEKSIKSFTEEIEWKAVSYYGGPETEGEYYTSNGDGQIKKLLFKPFGKCKDLVEEYMENRDVVLEWYDSYDKLSAEEILDLWKKNGVWYETHQFNDYDGFIETTIVIYRGDDIPKYFLEESFTGPIDSEIDTYEEVIEE